LFTANQLVAHLVGDFILQSEWMAVNKAQRSLPAALHALFYLLPFLFLTQRPEALVIISGTHFAIDRWRLARYVIWAKNRPWPGSRPWSECVGTGYPKDMPPWLSTWLFIIVDNTLHICINGAALTYLG
jgi:hypothetical protein